MLALLEQMKQVIYWNMKPKSGNLRQTKSDLDASGGTPIEFLKNVIPVSVGSLCKLKLFVLPPFSSTSCKAVVVFMLSTSPLTDQRNMAQVDAELPNLTNFS